MSFREFKFNSGKSALLLWRIKQAGDTYIIEHGLEGGAMQTALDRPGPKGKEGSKAYLDGAANCLVHIEREIKKKIDKGYIEYIDGKPLSIQINEIDFTKGLPKNFCGYKPQTSIEDAALVKLHKSGKARYTRKYDGFCHIAAHLTTGWEIYSRRMDVVTDKFPNHLFALQASKYQIGTVIVGEMVCQNPDGTDDFRSTSRVCRSLSEEARKLIADKEAPEPFFIVFDIIFYNGKDLKNTSYDDRHELWKNDFLSPSLIRSVEYFDLTPETWMGYAKKNNWEGFVVVDGSAIPGDKFYSYHGNSDRPKGHYKLKTVHDADVVIFAGLAGSGKNLDGIGSVFIKQRYPNFYPGTLEAHPKAGEWFFCGKAGSGFGEKSLSTTDLEILLVKNNLPILQKEKEAEEIDIKNENGLVTHIEYSARMPKTQKFRFPVFIRLRDDKLAKECFAEVLASEDVEDE